MLLYMACSAGCGRLVVDCYGPRHKAGHMHHRSPGWAAFRSAFCPFPSPAMIECAAASALEMIVGEVMGLAPLFFINNDFF